MGVYDDGVADLYDRFVPAFFFSLGDKHKVKLFEIDFSAATILDSFGNVYVGSMNGKVILTD